MHERLKFAYKCTLATFRNSNQTIEQIGTMYVNIVNYLNIEFHAKPYLNGHFLCQVELKMKQYQYPKRQIFF